VVEDLLDVEVEKRFLQRASQALASSTETK
jgi:hypothetical protein